MVAKAWILTVLLLTLISLIRVGRACAQDVGQQEPAVLVCPDSPNCVTSASRDEKHWVAPFFLNGDVAPGWKEVRKEAGALPRSRLVFESAGELHLECRSRVFRFVDDLHLVLDLEAKTVHVRSASRVGYWDFGANRRRIETLRAVLQKKGVVR